MQATLVVGSIPAETSRLLPPTVTSVVRIDLVAGCVLHRSLPMHLFVTAHSLSVQLAIVEVQSTGINPLPLLSSLHGSISVYSYPTLVVMNTILHTMCISTPPTPLFFRLHPSSNAHTPPPIKRNASCLTIFIQTLEGVHSQIIFLHTQKRMNSFHIAR